MYCFTYKYDIKLNLQLKSTNFSIPSTKDVNKVTLAALRLPAGRFKPIFSSFSLNNRPPFLLFALKKWHYISILTISFMEKMYLLKTPPNREAFKHSGGDNLRCTSATVTLYFDVLDKRLRRPGTEQNTSLGDPIPRLPGSLPLFIAVTKPTISSVII